MQLTDVILFQAQLNPAALALVGHGSVVSYGRLGQGIISASRRLTAIGLKAGDIVGIHVAHPIDHLVVALALNRTGVTSASVNDILQPCLDKIAFSAIISDRAIALIASDRKPIRQIIIDPSWFQDSIDLSIAERKEASTASSEWVCRLNYEPAASNDKIFETTAHQLELQVQTSAIVAPCAWKRMVTTLTSNTAAGFRHALSALWHGRTVCFTDEQNFRQISAAYRHDYLVTSTSHLRSVTDAQLRELVPIPTLRGVTVEDVRFDTPSLREATSSLSTQIICCFAPVALGIVAYAPAQQVLACPGSVGVLAPWVETQSIEGEEAGGAASLRMRLRSVSEALSDWVEITQARELSPARMLTLEAA